MKKLLLAYIASVCILQASSQQKDNTQKAGNSFKYSGTIQLGVLNGSGSSAFQAQTIHGLQYKTWVAGAGIGLDNYLYRTAPVFFEVKKNILTNASTPYLYGNAGFQIPWVSDKQNFWGDLYEYKTGLYYNLGAGYRFSIVKKYGLLFNASYSFKKVSEIFLPYCDVCGPTPPTKITNEYTLRRLSLMIGWGF